MNLKMFSIRDSKGEMFNPPFCEQTFATAERSFLQNQQNAETMISKYPEDYSLHYVGELNQSTGEITPHKPTLVCQATRSKNELKLQ